MNQQDAEYIASVFSENATGTGLSYRVVQDKASRRYRVEGSAPGAPPSLVVSTVVQFLHMHVSNAQNVVLTQVMGGLQMIANLVATSNPQAAAQVKAQMSAMAPLVSPDGTPLA